VPSLPHLMPPVQLLCPAHPPNAPVCACFHFSLNSAILLISRQQRYAIDTLFLSSGTDPPVFDYNGLLADPLQETVGSVLAPVLTITRNALHVFSFIFHSYTEPKCAYSHCRYPIEYTEQLRCFCRQSLYHFFLPFRSSASLFKKRHLRPPSH